MPQKPSFYVLMRKWGEILQVFLMFFANILPDFVRMPVFIDLQRQTKYSNQGKIAANLFKLPIKLLNLAARVHELGSLSC